MKERKIASFGTWDSPLSASSLFQHRNSLSNPVPWANGVLYLQVIPEEKSAVVLMFCNNSGEITRVTPKGHSVRSRVHEYGGLPFIGSHYQVFYCNDNNQEIYRQNFDVDTSSFSDPVQITESSGTQVRYCEFVIDTLRQRLICVREDHRASNGNAYAVINSLVALPLTDTLPISPDAQVVLFSESDFICNPYLSEDCKLISFVTWSHPNMPWDDTEVRVAQFCDKGLLMNVFEVDIENSSSKVQPSFDSSNNLYFISDCSDYWNLRIVDNQNLHSKCVSRSLYGVQADCCGPAWEMGKRNYVMLDETELILSVVQDCHWELQRLNVLTGEMIVLAEGLGLLEQIRKSEDGRIFYLAANHDDYPSIYRLDLDKVTNKYANSLIVKATLPKELALSLVSRPEHIKFVGENGVKAYGLFYSPRSLKFKGPCSELPPLLVNVHGGPTGTARAALNPMHQFWTSRGFAVLDLNHRGSSGYGRKFRKLLYGQWGVVDIEDIVIAVQYLIDSGQVAPDKIAIRGGSAGGYAVLASLAACDLFAAGTSYYGVSDLELLVRDTHKFESRYLDQLIGPYPEMKATYQARSPINSLANIEAAVLILQGEDDKVVPPNQAILVNKKLRAQNPGTEFISFKGEGHGFRLPANQIRSLEAELSFYRRNLLGLAM